MECCQNHPLVETDLAPCARCGRPFCPDCRVELQRRIYCADCKTEQVLDVLSGVNEAELDLAPLWKRGVAYTVDVVIFLAVAILALALMLALAPPEMKIDPGNPQHNQSVVLQLTPPLLNILTIYNLLYEGLLLQFRGQTVGKMAMGITVVTPEGRRISAGQAWGRTAIRVLCGRVQLIGLLVDYAFIFSTRRTCVHDLAARTRVVNGGPES